MRSRGARLTIGLAAWIVLGGIAFFLIRTERQIAERRAAVRAFEDRVAAAIASLGEARAAQQAYVAEGQAVEFWIPKVEALVQAASTAVNGLREGAFGGAARVMLTEAGSRITVLGNIDRRAREYLNSNERLMASDVVFGEGREAAAEAARLVEQARQTERQTWATYEASVRDLQASFLAGAALLVALVIALLAVARPRRAVDIREADDVPASAAPAPEPAALGELPLQVMSEAPQAGGGSSGDSGRLVGVGNSTELDFRRERDEWRGQNTDFKAAAELCTELGRVTTVEQMQTLVVRIATIMKATGLIVWLGDRDSGNLRPVLTCGYTAQTLARVPAVPRSADNAAAAAYRTGGLQIVRSRPGGACGALVAPLLTSVGCIGAFSVEIGGGSETSDTLQALAMIFAAQLAGVLAGSVPMSAEPPAAREAASA